MAACRDPSSAEHLHELKATADFEGRLDIVRMDIKDQASVEAAADHMKNTFGVSKMRTYLCCLLALYV